MKKRKKIILISSLIIIATIILISIRSQNNKKQKEECPHGLSMYCSSEYKPVCWNSNKTYDNSCIACFIWWEESYTEWKCSISLFNFIINKIK